MIKLRWLLKQVPRTFGIDDEIYHPPLADFLTVPVLQYRDVVEYFEDGSVKTATAWTDVQVEQEEVKAETAPKP